MKTHSIYILLFLFVGWTYGQTSPENSHSNNVKIVQTISAPEDGISFLAIGDFGRHGAFTQKEVARDMGAIAELVDLDFTLSVGDNFYPSGVQSTADYQWISSYESIYTHHLLHEPWYVALGNHDYEGSTQAQIDYSKISRRWEMPDRYFEKIIEIDDDNFLQLLIIDTNPMIEKYRENPKKYLEINQDTNAQLNWMKEKLSNTNPKIRWKIVVGHHPMYSGGKRKDYEETEHIKNTLEPLFEKYNVDAYITGHEHDLQIIQRPNTKVVQFLSGAGSELRETGVTSGTLFAESVPGFMAFTLTKDQLKVYVIESLKNTFNIIYQNQIDK